LPPDRIGLKELRVLRKRPVSDKNKRAHIPFAIKFAGSRRADLAAKFIFIFFTNPNGYRQGIVLIYLVIARFVKSLTGVLA
jgi:hypothetical protein